MSKDMRRAEFVALVGLGGAGLAMPVPVGAADASAETGVHIDAREADQVLAILTKLQAHDAVTAADWDLLFATRGYQRLKQREASFKRAFSDDDFKAFVTSPPLFAQTDALRDTLARWRAADIAAIEQFPLAYLPAGTTIHATVYPLIKPRHNSFVWETETDPAIMLYVDPSVTKEQFTNTVAHELLHIGDAQNCPPPAIAAAEKALSAPLQALLEWLSAFGEGWAVLAAAGGPNVHPHAADPPADRAVWDKAITGFDADFRTLEAFLLDVQAGRLSGDAMTKRGMTFFGDVQGPWYTVGYTMNVEIERTMGRPTLIAALCDKRHYLATYNAAARRANATVRAKLPLWVDALAGAFGADGTALG
jgi:putative zinc-dependent peptidase DUF5700